MANTVAGPVKDLKFVNSRFQIELGNGIKTKFITEVSGLSIDVQVADYTQGSSRALFSGNTPGSTKYGDITIKRFLTGDGDQDFWKWIKKIRDGGEPERTGGSIVLYAANMKDEVDRWTFENAWPSKWALSDLDVSSDAPMTETVTLTIETLTREKK